MPDALRRQGYNQEEEYFFQKNREAIRAFRQQLDSERQNVAGSENRTPHWMMCPKCGTKLVEHTTFGVKSDQCPACHGVFLDRGEIEMLTRSRSTNGVVETLRELLADATKPLPTGIGQFPV